MPYVSSSGVRIHYEVEGSLGSPLVLHHGNPGSGADWRDLGYVEALKGDHQLILIDGRGYGASEKPYQSSAYDLALRAADVVAVLDDMRIQRAHFLGYSMGGWIGFGLAKHAPERCRSMILGGAHPYAESMELVRSRIPADPETFVAGMAAVLGPSLTPSIRARLLATDLVAMRAANHDRSSLAEVIPTMKMPTLLYAGDADPRLPQVQECAGQLPQGSFVLLPGCHHVAGLLRSDLALPHIIRFLASVS